MTEIDSLDELSIQRLQLLNSPGSLYVGLEDNIRITTLCSQAGLVLGVRARVLMTDRRVVPCADTHTPTATRLATFSDILTPEGWLQGLEVFAISGSPRRGQCWVIVELIRGVGAPATVLQTLIQDYAQESSRIAWPNGGLRSSIEGPGNIRSITGADPAAGAEISEAVPTNARWRLISLKGILVASAVAGNRTVAMTLDDGTTVYLGTLASITQTVSQTQTYYFAEFGVFTAVTLVVIPVPLPTSIVLGQGHRIKTFTLGLDPGDNWAAPQYSVEEWIED